MAWHLNARPRMTLKDYPALLALQQLHDDSLVGSEEVALLLGLSAVTVRQRKVPGLPMPALRMHRLRWRLGDVRRWIREGCNVTSISKSTSNR